MKMRRSYQCEDVKWTQKALDHLREARYILLVVGANKTLARVRLAIKSAEGAVRHAHRIEARARGLE